MRFWGYVCSSGDIRTCCRLWRLFRWYTEITCFRFASNRKLFYRHLEFERVFHSFLYVAWRDRPCLLSPRMDPKLAVTICGHQEEVPACAYVGFLDLTANWCNFSYKCRIQIFPHRCMQVVQMRWKMTWIWVTCTNLCVMHGASNWSLRHSICPACTHLKCQLHVVVNLFLDVPSFLVSKKY